MLSHEPADVLEPSDDRQNLEDHQRISQNDQRWDWHQQPRAMHGASEPREAAPPVASFSCPDFDSTNLFQFNETEDVFQYLFPAPEATWPLPLTFDSAPQQSEYEDNGGSVRTVDETPGRNDENSPPALLQLNALIRDTVSENVIKNSCRF